MAWFGKPWYEQLRPSGYVQARKYKGVGHYQKELNKAIQHGWRAGDPAMTKMRYNVRGDVYVLVNFTKI